MMKKKNRMPVIFLAHGSPMNALEDNKFTQMLKGVGTRIPKPKAIICVSAHWQTTGTWVTGMQSPKTIHDFYGFPKELFEINYPAPGSPQLAIEVSKQVSQPKISIDENQWGLDHGAWSVLMHMYPEANIPVLQLSLDKDQPLNFYFKLGQELNLFREQGILIIGSGNIVHNLKTINWETNAEPFNWAIEFNTWIKEKIKQKEYQNIIDHYADTQAGKMSVPTLEHFLPLLVVLGASTIYEQEFIEFDGFQNASISMLSLSYGLSAVAAQKNRSISSVNS